MRSLDKLGMTGGVLFVPSLAKTYLGASPKLFAKRARAASAKTKARVERPVPVRRRFAAKLVEQARVELASYRLAERLSTRLCRNYLRGASSATEKSARQKPENRRCVGSGPPRLYPAFFDARIPPTGKGERTNRLTVN